MSNIVGWILIVVGILVLVTGSSIGGHLKFEITASAEHVELVGDELYTLSDIHHDRYDA